VLSLDIDEVVVGHCRHAINFAFDNQLSIVVNSDFKVHSYEPQEQQFASKIWQLSMLGKVLFSDIPVVIDLNKKFLVHQPRLRTSIRCGKVHLFSLERVLLDGHYYEVDYYRVIDWFDVRGPSQALLEVYPPQDSFRAIQSFETKRLDQKTLKRDVFVEQHLQEEDLQSLDYSDTATRQKLSKIISSTADGLNLRLWKRDVYPIEKPFYFMLEL